MFTQVPSDGFLVKQAQGARTRDLELELEVHISIEACHFQVLGQNIPTFSDFSEEWDSHYLVANVGRQLCLLTSAVTQINPRRARSSTRVHPEPSPPR